MLKSTTATTTTSGSPKPKMTITATSTAPGESGTTTTAKTTSNHHRLSNFSVASLLADTRPSVDRNSPPVITTSNISEDNVRLQRINRILGNKSPDKVDEDVVTDLSQQNQRLLDLNSTNLILNPQLNPGSQTSHIQKILANCNPNTTTSDEDYDSHEDENSIVDIEDVEEPSKTETKKQSCSDDETNPRKSPEFFIPGTPIRPTPFSALAAAWGQGVPIFGVPGAANSLPSGPGMSGTHPGISGTPGSTQGGWQRNPFITGHPMFQVSGQGQVFGHGSSNGE